MDKKSASSPPSMPSTSAHYQTPVPGPTTAQMIEGNVYNIIELFYSTTSSFGLKWCLECKLHLSTLTYTAKYVSQCNVSFFLQIFLVLDHKKLFSRSITAKIIRSTLYVYTYCTGASLAANMLQMGQIYGQVSQSSTSAANAQPTHANAPFYESAGQNRIEG